MGRKAVDLTGQRFGKLTVLRRVENSKHRALRWLCRCDCGREKVVFGQYLRNGRTTNCGCEPKPRGRRAGQKSPRSGNRTNHPERKPRIDLTGKRFGRLVVIGRADKKHNQYRWLCRCDCGKEVVVYGQPLRKGTTKSCGCLHREIVGQGLRLNRPLIKAGETFGHWTVLEDEIRGEPLIACRCVCGKERRVLKKMLLKGASRSCGCRGKGGTRKATTGKRRPRLHRLVIAHESKHAGVTWSGKLKQWRARIGVNQQDIYLGMHEHFADAVAARRKAEEMYRQEAECAVCKKKFLAAKTRQGLRKTCSARCAAILTTYRRAKVDYKRGKRADLPTLDEWVLKEFEE